VLIAAGKATERGSIDMQKFIILAIVVWSAMTLVVLNSSSPAAEIAAKPLTQPWAPRIMTDEFCGTKIDDASRAEIAKTEADRKWFAVTEQPTPRSVVNVHFHVIENGEAGAVDDETIATQIDVLNDSFNLRGISFVLASIDRTISKNWFTRCDAEGPLKRMKDALHLGVATDLNVYTCEPTRFLGRATFPWSYAGSPLEDGVIMHYRVLPGGSDPNFNTGEVLAHETGHWMGLYHTFQDGCTGAGDEVEDTPAEATPSFNTCPLGLDTCPSPGLDPTDNFMDLSGDACWTNFTAGQNDRMASMFAIYRYGQ
jgi:pregnancy-associated plasma protein-A